MSEIKLIAKSFKKMEDPCDSKSCTVKYVCYVQANSISQEFSNWLATNPREQKMSTYVAKKIIESLDNNSNFHELNRGILLSAHDVKYDTLTKEVTVTFLDSEKHGNIDGGHTLRAILDANSKNSIAEDRYVFFEIFTGIDSPVELAAARNTSVQVDLKSIEELKNSFHELKDVFSCLSFKERIQYKMNEHSLPNYTEIDIREMIAIVAMFSQNMYPYKDRNGLNDLQPIQCYSGKEATLRKFINMDSSDKKQQRINRDNMVRNMKPIIKDIFELWEEIERDFASVVTSAGKRYGTRKYSKYENGSIVGKTLFEQKDIQYIIPKGLMYPIVGAFRALIVIDNDTKEYSWQKQPLDVWKAIGTKLVTTILDEKTENPDVLAKNPNLWSNLFKEVYIYAYLSS